MQPEAAQQRGAESAEEDRGLTEAAPRPTQSGEGATGPTIKLKKVISRKKAGKQARTIIVTMPKEEAEMVDLGARSKKRGRPKKNSQCGSTGSAQGECVGP
jgi:hypothetical protein